MISYVFQVFLALAGPFFGAGAAFWFNIIYNKKQQSAIDETALSALVISIGTLTDKLLNLKKDMPARLEECNDLERFLNKECEHPDKLFEALFFEYQLVSLSFAVNMKDYIFIASHNPLTYRLTLVANNTVNEVNNNIQSLNKHIVKLRERGGSHFSRAELEVLCSYTKNMKESLDAGLFFLVMLSPLLVDIGLKRFRSFRIESLRIPDKYGSLIPDAGYIKGYEDLEKKSAVLAKEQL